MLLRSPHRVACAVLLLFALATTAQGLSFVPSGGMSFCKCTCFSNSTILPLYVPKDPAHPCLTCTRQFCLDQKLPSCLNAKPADEDLDTGTGEDGDVEARCFQRDSPKSHVVVVLFLTATGALLFAAVLKQYAGFDVTAIYNRDGLKGVAREIVQLGQSAAHEVRRRRRGRGRAEEGFTTMPMPN